MVPWPLQEVGYRHGMNWVAAVLLMFLEEEDTFWVLAQLMMKPRHAMHGRWPCTVGTHMPPCSTRLLGTQDSAFGGSPRSQVESLLSHQLRAL